MEDQTPPNSLKKVLTNCGNRYFGPNSLEIINNEKLGSINLHVNELSSDKFDGNQDDIQNSSVMPIYKDDYCKDLIVHTNCKNAVFDVVTFDDPIVKLDTLIKNFKDLIIGERLLTVGRYKTLELFSETSNVNGLENGKDFLTKNEFEGYVLEHKSIKSPKSSNCKKLTRKASTFENSLKTPKENIKDETERITIYKDASKLFLGNENPVAEKSDIGKWNERESDRVNPFEVSCQLFQENVFKFVIQTPLQTGIIDKRSSFPCNFVERYNRLEENHFKDDTKSLEIVPHGNVHEIKTSTTPKPDIENGSDIYSATRSDNFLMTDRVVGLEGDVEVDIHEAIRRDDLSLLRYLLAKGADPDEPDWGGKGDPPIVQAALKQNISIVKTLCVAGCDVNLTSVRGETALHMAVSRRPVSLPLLETLLSAGCDPNMQDKLRGCSALHCVSGFADDEPEVFLKLVAVTDVNLRDHKHSTVLHRIAATSNNVLRIKQLLALGADPNIQNDRGETALCVALERGWVAGTLALVAGGTDLSCTNLYRETALHVAARHDQANVVAALLFHGAEVNTQDLAGNTALHLAAGRGYIDTVRQLLTCPHLDLNTNNSDEATPLTCAVESGFISVVQMLVKAEQVDLQPALDLAKQGYRRLSQPEMCQLLTTELARRQAPHLT